MTCTHKLYQLLSYELDVRVFQNICSGGLERGGVSSLNIQILDVALRRIGKCAEAN